MLTVWVYHEFKYVKRDNTFQTKGEMGYKKSFNSMTKIRVKEKNGSKYKYEIKISRQR